MYYSSSLLALVALVSTVNAHGAIVKVTADKGTSQGFLVDQTLARNCTNISPCQQDSTIIRDAEITQNIVNSCGRTEIAGNIDVGEQTEAELAAGRMAQVSKGSKLDVTIHQVNADGAGPYECELDETSNAAVKFTKLQVANNVPGANGLSDAKEQNFTISVQMPQDFNCIGASTGDICTVRCRNTAVAGPFGGCFAVQQTDGTGRSADNSAASVTTAQTLQGISAQILQNQKDLPIAIAANQAAGAAEVAAANKDNAAGIAAIEGLLAVNPAPSAAATSAAAGATQAAGGNANNGNGNGKNNNNNNNGGNRGGNQNAAAGGNRGGNNANANAGNNANGNAGNNNGNGNRANGKANNRKRGFPFFS